MLGKYGQMKAQGNEMAENMKLDAYTQATNAVWPSMAVLPTEIKGKPR